MKIKGFLKDVGGASRVTKARLHAFETASASPEKDSCPSLSRMDNFPPGSAYPILHVLVKANSAGR